MHSIPRGSPDIEAIWHALAATGARSVAVAAASQGDGATTVALSVARRAGVAFGRALLVDLNQRRPGYAGLASPAPGETAAVGDGVFLLASPPPGEEGAWGEPAALAALVRGWAESWDFVVLDTAPLLSREPQPVPGPMAAAAADAALLVSMTGYNPANRVAESVSVLGRSGARLAGVVMNDLRDPPLLLELERKTRGLGRFFPRLADAVRGRLRRSPLLAIRI